MFISIVKLYGILSPSATVVSVFNVVSNFRIEFVFTSVTYKFPTSSVTIPIKLALFVFVIVVTFPAANTVLVVFVKSLFSEIKVTPFIDKYLYFKYPYARVILRRICGPKLFKFKNLPAAISFADA